MAGGAMIAVNVIFGSLIIAIGLIIAFIGLRVKQTKPFYRELKETLAKYINETDIILESSSELKIDYTEWLKDPESFRGYTTNNPELNRLKRHNRKFGEIENKLNILCLQLGDGRLQNKIHELKNWKAWEDSFASLTARSFGGKLPEPILKIDGLRKKALRKIYGEIMTEIDELEKGAKHKHIV